MLAILYKIILFAPPLLIAVMLHEIAHGLAAERLGDYTARRLGRITLNPIRHIDPFMTILLPTLLVWSGSPVVFGGAKPVPINALSFNNPRRGMAYVALAGPAMNFTLAAVSYGLLNALLYIQRAGAIPGAGMFEAWLVLSLIINLVLALFNLVPVPPLDGGRIVIGFLPLSLARHWARLEPFGIIIVFALLYQGTLDRILAPAFRLLEHLPLVQ